MPQYGVHMGILGSDHAIDYAAVTTHTPGIASIMFIGVLLDPNTIFQTPGWVWVGDYCVVNRVITPEDSHVGPNIWAFIVQNAQKQWSPLFFEFFSKAPIEKCYTCCFRTG